MDDEPRAPADPVTQRAELARQVTENPVFEEAVESMRMHFVDHIVHTTPDQTNVREEAYKQLRHLQMFLDTLKGWVETAAARREEMNLP
jgi:hypothetical protein